jgi:hypothetical protein
MGNPRAANLLTPYFSLAAQAESNPLRRISFHAHGFGVNTAL